MNPTPSEQKTPTPSPSNTPRTYMAAAEGLMCLMAEAEEMETSLIHVTKERDRLLDDIEKSGTDLAAKSAEVEELQQQVCDECNGDGWCENRVEGRVPCVCVNEKEAYQIAIAEVERLTLENERLESRLAQAGELATALQKAEASIAVKDEALREAETYVVAVPQGSTWRDHQTLLLAQIRAAKDSTGSELLERLKRHDEGEKWIASMLAKIMATAASGFAETVVVGDGPFTAEHALGTVSMLRDHAKDMEALCDRLGKALEDVRGACIGKVSPKSPAWGIMDAILSEWKGRRG
jgi:hypothetical protein